MFGIDITIIAFVGLTTLGVAGLVYAFMFNRIADESKQAKRLDSLNNRDVAKNTKAAARLNDAAKRRQTVQESLKELEAKRQEKRGQKFGLKKIIQQSGLKFTIRQFFMMSFAFGILVTLITLLTGNGPLVSGLRRQYCVGGVVGGIA